MDKNERARVIFAAERIERATKAKGRPSGDIGQTGLAILRCLLFRFGTGPCTPSYKAIKRATGFCLQTISDGLKRLRAAGLLHVEHRTRRTRLGARRDTNAYEFPRQMSLTLPDRPHKEPLEKKGFSAKFVPFEQLAGPLRAALDALGARITAKESCS